MVKCPGTTSIILNFHKQTERLMGVGYLPMLTIHHGLHELILRLFIRQRSLKYPTAQEIILPLLSLKILSMWLPEHVLVFRWMIKTEMSLLILTRKILRERLVLSV